MGNVPAKESRSRSLSFSSFPLSAGTGPTGRSARRHTLLSANGLSRKPSARPEEKLAAKEAHCMLLVVRYKENVDGGYLAPHGTYKLNLDFDTAIVRTLIVERRLAPFYTPLQDFDDSWTDDEVYALVKQNPLHAVDAAYESDTLDDLDDHKIHKLLNYYRRQEQKKRQAEMMARVKEEQQRCEQAYFDARAQGEDKDLSSRDLILKLYRSALECPICFLYFPVSLNYSRCCRQPICTECFVQIKRLDPHPPHDDPTEGKDDELPHTLISEYANCPYCAMGNFGVTYDPPRDVRVGLGGICIPSEYTSRSAIEVISEANSEDAVSDDAPASPVPQSKRTPRRKSSMAAESDAVVTTDYIRPGWEQKLASARSRLARKAATASAIHASNLILPGEGATSRLLLLQPNQLYLVSLEDRMIEEAMRLLLLDEEERRAKARRKGLA